MTRTAITNTIAAAGAVLLSPAGFAQIGTPSFTDTGMVDPFTSAVRRQTLNLSAASPASRGKFCSEVLRGTGSRAGYALSHGGIIPESVSVSVNARRLSHGEYFVDADSGSMGFLEPVTRFSSVSLSYRYIEGQDGNRTPVAGVSGLSLNLNGSALNFGFGVSTNAAGLDFTTYGLALNSKLGAGAGSALNGLVYFSTPGASKNNLVGSTREALDASAKKAASPDAVNDHLISQNLNYNTGAITLRANYQDVGSHFNGFQAMKASNAKNADVLAQIGAMEKEKGIKRLGFGADVKTAKTSSLGFDWNQIGDGTDHVTHQSIGYASKLFNFKFSEQQVGENFAGFKSLREADAAQWAREKGMKRSDLSLGMVTGKDSKLDFSRNAASDKTGALERENLALAAKSLSFSMSSTKADAKFTRLNDLADADKTNLLLDIHRQFNPNAQSAEIAAPEKANLAGEAGLSRSRMTFGGALGKTSSFAINQFSIGDDTGSIQRQTINLSTKTFTVNYLDQTIGDKFGHLGAMGAFEKAQFGNEVGIHRQAFGLNWTPSKNSTFAISQLDLSDSQKGGMSRETLAYATKGVDFKMNKQNIAKTFDRFGDLAGFTPQEKQTMQAEQGYDRTDWTANINAMRGLTLSTYNYDAHNSTDGLDKSAWKHSLAWTGSKLTQINFLSEGSMYEQAGKLQDAVSHDLLTINHLFGKGMKLNYFHDTLARTASGSGLPSIATDYLHFETDRGKANNVLAETKRMAFSDGKYENTTQVDLNYRANKSLAVHFNKLGIDRGKDPSSDTSALDWKWQFNKSFSFNGAYATTTTNNNADTTVKTIGLAAAINRDFNIAGTYTEANSKTNIKSVADVSLSNAKPVNVLGLKNVTVTGKFAALRDQNKQQSQNVGGKVAGLVGKNQFGVEYTSVLNPNGTNAIARIITFLTDPNPKLPFHADILYKARTMNRGNVDLVRKYNAALKIDKSTNATYTYTSLPETPANVMQPIKTSAFVLKRAIDRTLTLGVDYTTNEQVAAQTEISKLGATIGGKVDPQTAVEFGYSVDRSILTNQPHMDSHTMRFSYDHQVDGDHFVTLSTTFREIKGASDEVSANVDLKTRF
jgi:hypothetical protein